MCLSEHAIYSWADLFLQRKKETDLLKQKKLEESHAITMKSRWFDINALCELPLTLTGCIVGGHQILVKSKWDYRNILLYRTGHASSEINNMLKKLTLANPMLAKRIYVLIMAFYGIISDTDEKGWAFEYLGSFYGLQSIVDNVPHLWKYLRYCWKETDFRRPH